MNDSGSMERCESEAKYNGSALISTGNDAQCRLECDTKTPASSTDSSLSPAHQLDLVEKVTSYVKDYMSNYDSSHDFDHVLRVLGLARLIASRQPGASAAADASVSAYEYDPIIITLSSLLHDVGDKKYLKPGDNADTMVYEVLLTFGAPKSLAATVQTVASNVSFSAETKSVESREKLQRLVQEIPELGVVQDADRLDAMGAVGIGRTFTYGGGKGRSLQATIEHFTEKLERLESLMKTTAGKSLAVERTRRLKLLREWREEEQHEAQEGLVA